MKSTMKSTTKSTLYPWVNGYHQCAISTLSPEPDQETNPGDYYPCHWTLLGKKFKTRIGKITPIKTGCFVSLYRKVRAGVHVPLSYLDDFDGLIVFYKHKEQVGQFIFPKHTLGQQNIIQNSQGKGKLAFRLYTPWDKPHNTQAKRIQEWQKKFFIIGFDKQSLIKAITSI